MSFDEMRKDVQLNLSETLRCSNTFANKRLPVLLIFTHGVARRAPDHQAHARSRLYPSVDG